MQQIKEFSTRIFIIIFGLFFQSCINIYTPNMQNVPMFKEKNEMRTTLSLTNYQGAYSISEHIGIMVNGQYDKRNDRESGSIGFFGGNYYYDRESKITLIEAGTGYFSSFRKWGIYEIYGGGGTGNVNMINSYIETSTDSSNSSFYNLNSKTTRLFIQAGFGYCDDIGDLVFSTRLVGFNFSDIHIYEGGDQSPFKYDFPFNQLEKSSYIFFEPGFTCRVGWKYIKFHTQAILSYQLNSKPYLDWPVLSFNMGVHINLAPRFIYKHKIIIPN